jgi:hypothetical protein
MVGHAAHMGEMHTEFYSHNMKGRDHFGDIGIYGKEWTAVIRLRLRVNDRLL